MASDRKHYITTHFSLEELGSPPSALYENARILALQLQRARSILGRALVVVSGYRDLIHNARVGGTKDSQHLYARAGDLIVPDPDGSETYRYATGRVVRCWSGARLYGFFDALMRSEQIINGGLGLYRNRVHYDTRNKPARWRG